MFITHAAAPSTDLLSCDDLAAMLDERPSKIRGWATGDVDQLPKPIRMAGVPYWPRGLVESWLRNGRPSGYAGNPRDFLPRAVDSMTDEARQ